MLLRRLSAPLALWLWAAGCAAATPPPMPTIVPTLHLLASTATPTPEPVRQMIGVTEPAPGEQVSETIVLVGEISLTPLEQQLTARVIDNRNRAVLTQTVPVDGKPGTRGVFSRSLTLPFVLPGVLTLEVSAPDAVVQVGLSVPARLAAPAPGVQLTLNGVAQEARAYPLDLVAPERSWLPLFGHPPGLQILFDADKPSARFDPRQRQLLILPAARYRALYTGAEVNEFDAHLEAIMQGVVPGRTVLPVSDWEPMLAATPAPLRFANGRGVRWVTMFTQQIQPVLANSLTYVFQGLSEDKQYFIAAFIPVTSTTLPSEVTRAQREQVRMDYRRYLTNVARLLEHEGGSFSPPLEALDAMIASLTLSESLALDSAAPGGAFLQATARLNVRAGPGTGFAVIGQLAPGERMRALARTTGGDWVQIALPSGQRGWVNAQYVSPRAVIRSLPVAAP
ncbi:MAG: SH3 domain-containing protein [Thermoflexales bacterium]|nr:SH3 domain-containing protein [Thermoflexales bacterium]